MALGEVVNSTSHSIVEGPYLHDILDQPQALEATLKGLRGSADLFFRIGQIRQQEHTRVVLTGMGSSLHALYPLELMLTALGENVARIETSELIHSMPSLLGSRTVVVAVSQSGQSAEMVRLLEQNAKRATVIGVTNTADSPLAMQAELTVPTRCGPEFSVSAKTYVGTLAALEVLGAAWCGKDAGALYVELEAARAMVSCYLAKWREQVESIVEEMQNIGQLFIVGRGRSLASCETGALITKESTRSFAEGMSSAAFRHGPMEMVGPKTMVLVFEGEAHLRALNCKLVRDIRANGGRAELVGPTAEIDAMRIPGNCTRLLPIMEILPIQMTTLAFAARAGFEAGRFARAMKVTTEE
jgi:glucosamine--fructose-6-phosphate aminotransferase (isomerizing)